jgi:hypothetical protein
VRYSFAESIRSEREESHGAEEGADFLDNLDEILEGDIQRAKSAERRDRFDESHISADIFSDNFSPQILEEFPSKTRF